MERIEAKWFSDKQLAVFIKKFIKEVNENQTIKLEDLESKIRAERLKKGVKPIFKKIDTTSGEYITKSNYLYATYHGEESDIEKYNNGNKSIIIIGSGPYQIGSSVEFDWCATTASEFCKENNLNSIVINCNPETVSTDFDISNRLYFEEISLERILDIFEYEKPEGIIASFGGQTSNCLVSPLGKNGVKIIGHDPKTVDLAENRESFSKQLDKLKIKQPKWKSAKSKDDLEAFIKDVGFPVLVRPSYVLSGSAMRVAYSKNKLEEFLLNAHKISADFPVVITEFIEGAKEVEFDGIARNGEVLTGFVSEHIENAGVHSGDATVIFPSQKILSESMHQIKNITQQISKSLNLNGPFNIQFLVKNNEIKVIECNARASRSFPFISKVSGTNLIKLSLKSLFDKKLPFVPSFNQSKNGIIGVKAAMFSFSRLEGADPALGVEMASTGEVGCLGRDLEEALLLAMESTSINIPKKGILISTGQVKENKKLLKTLTSIFKMQIDVYATPKTAEYMIRNGLPVKEVSLEEDSQFSAFDLLKMNKVDLIINLPKSFKEKDEVQSNYRIRKFAKIKNYTLITEINKAIKFLDSIIKRNEIQDREVLSLGYTEHII